MCGIAGQFNFKQSGDDELVKKMTRKMIHRGPDSEGYYNHGGISLGMRRLKIIDLSTGDQPIHNEDKTVWTVFNGEIYNYKELKKDLESKGHSFYTKSDTEVLVHLYEEYGDDFLQKLNGMFGLAIWDEKNRRLVLGRDRTGEKSLYYYSDGEQLLFASELKSILESGKINRKINLEALHYYLMFGRVPSPYSIIENVKKLEPAEMLVVKDSTVILKKYWSLSFVNKLESNEEEIKKELLRRLEKSVKDRMEADVPLGAFLSGGVDSSAVVALMAKNSSKPIETFSVGFEEKDFSELNYAKQIADKFGTNHHEFIMRPDVLGLLPKLVYHMDEPFSDYSILPTYFISEETKKFVTVALTGDGADELFAGYESYKAIKIAQYYNKTPKLLKDLIYKITQKLPNIDEREKITRYLHKLKRLAETQRNTGSDPLKIFLSITSGFTEETLKNGLYNDKIRDKIIQYNGLKWRQKFTREYDGDNDIEAVLYSQFKTLLPDMFFTKVDRCSMAASLETRAPFADHELVEFIAKIPFEYKLHGLKTKYILKEALRGTLPDEVLFRHKKGFSMPLHRWIRGEEFWNKIKDSILDKKMLDLFDEKYITELLESYKNGMHSNFDKIWRLYMFALWQDEYLPC